MKKSLILIFLAVLLAFPFLSGMVQDGWNGEEASAKTGDEFHKTISVNGVGKVELEPDIAYIEFGLETEAKTAKEAQSKNAGIFEDVKNVLSGEGIPEKDIQTIRYHIYPNYDYRTMLNGGNKERVLTGYRVNHTIQVTWRDMDGIGKLLDALTGAGINRVQSIQFGIENKDAYVIKALEKAMESARAKADALAKQEGTSISGVLHIDESGGGYTPVYRNADMEMAANVSADSVASTNVYSGELTIQKTVRVVYEFK